MVQLFNTSIHLGDWIHTLLVWVVNLHVLLKIKEGKLISLTHLEKLAKSRIRKDLALVFRILKVVLLAVGIDSLSHRCARNQLILLETQKLG